MSERGKQSFEHERNAIAIRLDGGQKGRVGSKAERQQGRAGSRAGQAAGQGRGAARQQGRVWQQGGAGQQSRATQQGGATRQQGGRQLHAWFIPGIAFHGVPWALW